MAWPLGSDFCQMVQQPRVAFRDPRLQTVRLERTNWNQPRVWAGQFAVVFKGIDAQGKTCALRAFTTAAEHRREHYAEISRHLSAHRLRCLVDFAYRDAAIRSARDGKWYPLVVMDWVEGATLLEWLRSKCSQGKAAAIAKAVGHWSVLVEELRAARVAHGDLQHGNVLITSQGRMKLVDYDGMCVPALAGRPNVEVGVAPYQHPQRNSTTPLSATLDHFSALLIYVALRALAADVTLWAKHVEQTRYDRLLFRPEDFRDRERSALFRDLLASPDLGVRDLAAELFALARGPLDQVPALAELIGGGVKSAARGGAASPPPVPAARGVLEVVAGPAKGQRFVLAAHDTWMLGRGDDCHLRILDDPHVSRHHFLLETALPLARLRDLDSRNGTWVNDTRCGGRAARAGGTAPRNGAEVALRPGDQIRVGQTVIQFRAEAATEAAPARSEPRAAPPAAAKATPGRRMVERLKIGPLIGRGHSAVVYRARHKGDPAVVALKLLEPPIDLSADDRRRVLDALKPFQKLRHPCLARVLEAGLLPDQQDQVYFVVEYCDGGNLTQHLHAHGGKLTLDQACPLMLQCLGALASAHREELVHGDLRPQNILIHRLAGKPVARITDFGLARVLERTGCTGLTTTGRPALEYQFLPRERLIGFQVGPCETDVWGLAAVFYHMLSGQFPYDFSGREPLRVILQSETRPLRERVRTIPAALAQVIDQALAADPRQRFPSAVELKTHMEKALGLAASAYSVRGTP